MTDEKKFNPDEPQKFANKITIAGVEYTHYKLRDIGLKDMFDAEIEVTKMGGGIETPLLYNGMCMVFQVTEVSNIKGDKFEGPFTLNMLTNWGPRNYWAMRKTQKELDQLGEAGSSDSSPD